MNSINIQRTGIPCEAQELDEILNKYPWFLSARIIKSCLNNQSDPFLALYLLTNPAPILSLKSFNEVYVTETEDSVASVATDRFTDQNKLIDDFLSKGEYRIMPSDTTPDTDVSMNCSILDTDEVASEELAEIFRAQGLQDKADEIMAKLQQNQPDL